jgi:hypothetical protein
VLKKLLLTTYLILTSLLSFAMGSDLGSATVTGHNVTPPETVRTEKVDFYFPETHSIEVEGQGWIDVPPDVYQSCSAGEEYPSCGGA